MAVLTACLYVHTYKVTDHLAVQVAQTITYVNVTKYVQYLHEMAAEVIAF